MQDLCEQHSLNTHIYIRPYKILYIIFFLYIYKNVSIGTKWNVWRMNIIKLDFTVDPGIHGFLLAMILSMIFLTHGAEGSRQISCPVVIKVAMISKSLQCGLGGKSSTLSMCFPMRRLSVSMQRQRGSTARPLKLIPSMMVRNARKTITHTEMILLVILPKWV